MAVSRQAAKHFKAVVVGAGPGGLTSASALLDRGLANICMVDPSFNAGRINERYREVPSNTKTATFADWATGTDTFSEIIQQAPRGNAFQKLKSLDQDKGCQLADAVDVAKLLSDGLRVDSRVTALATRVQSLEKRGHQWALPDLDITADRVVLASGAHPRANPLVAQHPHLTPLDLDTALAPSLLRKAVSAGSKVAVVGSSHSAILALKNLFDMGNIEIVNFYRSPLLYAVYKDGWILYDNTGLKGEAAVWAKEVLDSGRLPPNIRRVGLKDQAKSEKRVYDEELKGCTHIVSAIGYDRNGLPIMKENGRPLNPEFDQLTGKFYRAQQESEYLGGLYGAGIAFPERIIDPAGNVESAVGFFKFMKFVKRVGPQWVEESP